MLKLAVWLKQMGYFNTVNFVFLIVGHTQNAADCLFNSLKHEYRKNNIYTMQALIEHLSASDSVTIWPSEPDDFLNYDALFNDIYCDLLGKVQQNHIFSCSRDCLLPILSLQESNIDEHQVSNHAVSKKFGANQMGQYMLVGSTMVVSPLSMVLFLSRNITICGRGTILN